MSEKMPALFVGHGSPTYAVEETVFSDGWRKLAGVLPKPKAIIAVSAHWYTMGTKLCSDEQPKMIYDMYGFPQELYEVKYPAPGDPELAEKTAGLLGRAASIDNTWGIDHGLWSVLRRLYPDADVPVIPMSVDAGASPEQHFELGRKLGELRSEGVMIFASGNVVHNLAAVDWDMQRGYDWADEFDGWVKTRVLERKFAEIFNYRSAGDCSKNAFTTPEHFLPLLYALGASDKTDEVSVWNDLRTMGAISMTSYLFK